MACKHDVAERHEDSREPKPSDLGRKDDTEKVQLGLLPSRAIVEIGKVLTFGARKYAPDNWKHVPNAQSRYVDALLRHVFAWMDGERDDSESGLHHLAHAGCCILFLLWFETSAGDARE